MDIFEIQKSILYIFYPIFILFDMVIYRTITIVFIPGFEIMHLKFYNVPLKHNRDADHLQV